MRFLKCTFAFAILFNVITVARADDSTSMLSCLGEVRTVCSGLESNLDQCVSERAARFSDACLGSLKKTMASVSSNPGLSSCVNDIQSACGGLEGVSLGQCIESKKAGFSKPCQDYLGGSTPPQQ